MVQKCRLKKQVMGLKRTDRFSARLNGGRSEGLGGLCNWRVGLGFVPQSYTDGKNYSRISVLDSGTRNLI